MIKFVGQFLTIFNLIVELISIVSKKCSDETAHICADDNKEKENNIEKKFDSKIMCRIKFNRKIDDQERNSYQQNQIDGKIYEQDGLYPHKLKRIHEVCFAKIDTTS